MGIGGSVAMSFDSSKMSQEKSSIFGSKEMAWEIGNKEDHR